MAESFCLNILEILEKLKAGFCTIRGFLCYELYKSRQKIMELKGKSSNRLIQFEDFGLAIRNFDDYLKQTMCLILKDSVAAPTDLEMFY